MARLLRCTVLAAAAASVAAKCADNAAWRGNSPDKGCDWVGLMSKKRCAYKGLVGGVGKKVTANTACTITCGTCKDLLCTIAESQTPRNVTTGAVGLKRTRGKPVANVNKLVHVNTHWHDGAEHFSAGEYDTLHENAGGYYCDSLSLTATPAQLEPFEFKHCMDMEVGSTYEMHWVHSSGGTSIGVGLGGAFARQANPLVVVQAQVFLVVNDDDYTQDQFIGGWVGDLVTNGVKYLGSTTGTSYDNEVCSPYLVSWHVDRECHMIAASTMDAMCHDMMMLYDMHVDVEAHASRVLVSPEFSAIDVYAL
ncbi:hypothetical protein M885DRAFT_492562 [Pelagophyceae sp. CCMP2097]|nr:hypothetical protein M885DRAFT_492562 [Pelagophyceae sp. CCMP2097]